jgi:hypothetical protein
MRTIAPRETDPAAPGPRRGAWGLQENTMAIIRTINAAGRAEIAAFLAENHKKGGTHFTDSMLHAWAADAEFQMSEGNTPTIEIRSFDSVSGHTETFTVSDAGIDSELIEDEDD